MTCLLQREDVMFGNKSAEEKSTPPQQTYRISFILKSPQTQHFPALPSAYFTLLFAPLSLPVFDIHFHSTFPSPYTLTDLPMAVYTF